MSTRLRRAAALRCPPRDCGCEHAHHADPLDCLALPPGPSTYSLPTTVLYRHAADLAAQGWQPYELRRRFALRAVPTR